ncbi:MAG: YncE family protein [Chlamydiales bacterium]
MKTLHILFLIIVLIISNQNKVLATPFGYVCNSGDGTVTVFDVATDTVTATVTVGADPEDVAITPDGAFAYVTNNGSGNVSVIDTSTNTVTATVTVGTGPYGVTITPDGSFAYVSNNSSSNVSVIDIGTNTVIATVPLTGFAPQGIDTSVDGSKVYVVNNSSSTVDVISTGTNTVSTTIPLGLFEFPVDVAFAPDGSIAYVTNSAIPGSISIIDVSSDTIIGTIPGSLTVLEGPTIVDFSPDSTIAYVVDLPNSQIVIIDVSSSTISGTISGTGTGYVVFTPDGQKAYVSGAGPSDSEVDDIDVGTSSITATVQAGNNSRGIAITPLQQELVVNGQCCTQKFLAQTETFVFLTWNAVTDGSNIVYVIFRDNIIIAYVTGTSYTDHNVAPCRSYVYE